MQIVIFPGKTLNYQNSLSIAKTSQRTLMKRSEILVDQLRDYPSKKLSSLMSVERDAALSAKDRTKLADHGKNPYGSVATEATDLGALANQQSSR